MKTIAQIIGTSLLMVLCSGAHAGLHIQIPASYAEGGIVSPAVKAECGLDTLYSSSALEFLSKRYPDIQATVDGKDVGQDPWIRLTIMAAVGAPGGPSSGSKSVTVRAELVQNDKVLSTFDKNAEGGRGGVFGQVFRGTCDIMQKLTIGLAKHTYKWAGNAYQTSQTLSAPSSAEAASEATGSSK